MQAVVLVTHGSVFEVRGGILAACPPGCPLLICQGEAVAHDFFEECIRRQQDKCQPSAPFIAANDLFKQTCAPTSGAECLASCTTMVPLPNGDTVVWQLPLAESTTGTYDASAVPSKFAPSAHKALCKMCSELPLRRLAALDAYLHVAELVHIAVRGHEPHVNTKPYKVDVVRLCWLFCESVDSLRSSRARPCYFSDFRLGRRIGTD